MGETDEVTVIGSEVSGVQVAVEVGGRELVPRICEALSLKVQQRPGGRGTDGGFAIDLAPEGGYRVVVPEAGEPFFCGDLEGAVDRLRDGVLDHVALHAPDQLLVSGAAVAMGDRAIVLLGDDGRELSALVEALVQAGATAYADGYVPVDLSGHVHLATLDSAALVADGQAARPPATIAVIAVLARREGGGLALRGGLRDDGLLTLLGHAGGADVRPEFALVVARTALHEAALVVGQWDRAEQVAAALIERLARGAGRPSQEPAGRLSPERQVPTTTQFASLVLQLEATLARLAETLTGAGIEAVLVNGDQVRPAFAHGFALSFSALLEVPRSQIPRALTVMEQAGWVPVPGERRARFTQHGVTVRLLPRPRLPLGRERPSRQQVVSGRLGFNEPSANLGDQVPAAEPVPFDPGGRSRTGVIAEGLTLVTEALAALDTSRLRGREQYVGGVPMRCGPGVFAFESVEPLVTGLLERLPASRSGLRVVEMGTGTGIVALSLARARPDVRVLATDVSLRALGWARLNRRRLGVRNVRLAQGSLLAPVPKGWRGRVDAIVANPPFALPANAIEFRKLDWPVGTATGPGADGLGLVRALARDAREVLAPDGLLFVQMLGTQGPWIAGYLDELGFDAEIPPPETVYIEVAARWPG